MAAFQLHSNRLHFLLYVHLLFKKNEIVFFISEYASLMQNYIPPINFIKLTGRRIVLG